MTGDTFTVTSLGGGKLHYTNGSTVAFDFACDGKEYKILADRTGVCIKNSETSFDVTNKVKGVEVAKNHREISADGKTLSMAITGSRPDGTKYTENDVYERVSGGPGLAGKWKNVKTATSAADILVLKVTPPDSLHWEVPAYKQTASGKLDGKPIVVTGPTTPEGLTMAFTKVSDAKLTYTVKLKDKVMNEGVQTLSADGKTLTDTSWVPGKETEKEVDIYNKQ